MPNASLTLNKGNIFGHCLCERVSFTVTAPLPRLYRCHCSLCRRQGGSSASAALLLPRQAFLWKGGREHVSSWTRDSGFRNDFCNVCGSPLPVPLRQTSWMWVPAGLLPGGLELQVAAHLCLASSARWDPLPRDGLCLEHLPDNLDEFISWLHKP